MKLYLDDISVQTVNAIKNTTTIQLNIDTRNHLASIGKKDQSFDDLVSEILKHVKTCDRWWCENR